MERSYNDRYNISLSFVLENRGFLPRTTTRRRGHDAGCFHAYHDAVREVALAFGAPLVPCLATWSPSASLCELARFEPRRALDEAIAELRHLLDHTAPVRGGAVQGGMLFLPSGLTLKLSATPPSCQHSDALKSCSRQGRSLT